MSALPAHSQCQLYVGDLPTNIDKDFLTSLFKDYGTITDIQIKQKPGAQRQFAFVTFQTPEEAQHALNENNYTKLDGVPMRISIADQGFNSIKNSNTGNLFISGLDPSIEVAQLHEAFANFGEIISCKIPLTDNKSRGYGYIQFKNKESAEAAKRDLADASINGQKITIQDYTPQPKKNLDETFQNVYVKFLPPSFDTKEKIIELFSEFGEVQSPYLPLDENNKPKGFAQCNMRTHEDAVRAVQGLNGREIEGCKLEATRAMSKKERAAFLLKQSREFRRMKNKETEGRNLFVKGFGTEAKEEDLQNYFQEFGEIEKVAIAYDRDKTSKGFGFILYKEKEGANNAIAQATMKNFPLTQSSLYVTLFKPKEERQREALRQRNPKPVAPAYPLTPDMQQMQPQPFIHPQYKEGPKDHIKKLLLEKGKSGKSLSQILASKSDDQFQRLLDNEALLNRWLDSLN